MKISAAAILALGLILALCNSREVYHWYMRNCGLYREVCGGEYITVEEYRLARSNQITSMVTRFNQFLPGGAAPIELEDGRTYTPADLTGLVTAGYCADSDLQNQMGGDWVWVADKRRFEPEPTATSSRP